MIEHVYRRAAEARGVDAVVVATDDDRIAAAVERFGGVVRMTRPDHRTGTDRMAEIARDLPCRILINVQGDLPLVEPRMIEQIVDEMSGDSTVRMSTVCRRIVDAEDYGNPHVVKVVVDRAGNAMYFSRAPIPYLRQDGGKYVPGSSRVYRHIGMYAYRRDFLLEFAALPQTELEQAESLEQLRALEHGIRIRTVETQYESIEVDTPDDLERVRRLVAAPVRQRNAAELFR
jgi:3-deoxy-manno-octulosonate cytidylyltransferase (CMP-KDO synthetase)